MKSKNINKHKLMEKGQKQWEEDRIRRWYYGNQRKVEQNEEYMERQEEEGGDHKPQVRAYRVKYKPV